MRAFPESCLAFPVVLQRDAFGPRLVARAGDVWRAMQDVVVDQSSSVGWPPERYVAADRMFVVRSMTVVHHREVRLHDALTGRTWPSRARREMLFTREVRLLSGDELVATATQEWALLSRQLVPVRAGPELFDAFTLIPGFPATELPAIEPGPGAHASTFSFRTWHVWMDSLGHINHPAYVDACDEGVARLVAAAGVDPQALSPVAEEVVFKAAIGADEEVVVETVRAGTAGDAVAFRHRISASGRPCATAVTIRRGPGPSPAWTGFVNAPG